jgi:Sec-independent protein secretion pathway component TatC
MKYSIWVNMWETLSDRTIAGYSIKKVMAAFAITVLLALTAIYTDKSNILAVIPMWQTFILSLVVVRAVEKVKGVSDKPETENKTNENL